MHFFVQLARILYILLRDVAVLSRVFENLIGKRDLPRFRDLGWILIKVDRNGFQGVEAKSGKGGVMRNRAPWGLVLLDSTELGCSAYVYHDISDTQTVLYSVSEDVPFTVLAVLRPNNATTGGVRVQSPVIKCPPTFLESKVFKLLALIAWTARNVNAPEYRPGEIVVVDRELHVGHVYAVFKSIMMYKCIENACNYTWPKLFGMAAQESSQDDQKGIVFSVVSFLDITRNVDYDDFAHLMVRSRFLRNCEYFHNTVHVHLLATVNALNLQMDEVNRQYRNFAIN